VIGRHLVSCAVEGVTANVANATVLQAGQDLRVTARRMKAIAWTLSLVSSVLDTASVFVGLASARMMVTQGRTVQSVQFAQINAKASGIVWNARLGWMNVLPSAWMRK